ncbi:unnamed protein product [Ectocarpus sp. CCAP 1310/34]|nr:unnamed protein product [Ectocarpus sp. CCAP 1310/34]
MCEVSLSPLNASMCLAKSKPTHL